MSFDSYKVAENALVTDEYYAVILLGYYVIHDAPPIIYTRWTNSGEPPHPAKFKTFRLVNNVPVDVWWEMSPPGDHLDVRWFGAKIDGTDDRVAFETAIKCASPPQVNGYDPFSIRRVFVPEGHMTVDGPDVLIRGVTIVGAGVQGSFIDSNVTGNQTFLRFDGGVGVGTDDDKLTGGGLQNIIIWKTAALTGGIAVHLEGNNIKQPDEAVCEDLKITGTGSWKYPLYLNGSARTTGTIGLRKVTFRNLFLGNAETYAFFAVCVGDLSVYNLGTFGEAKVNDVKVSNNHVHITGSEQTKSTIVQLLGCNIQGYTWIYFCNGANLSSYCSIVVFGNGSRACGFYGTLGTPGGYANSGIGNLNYATTF
jgi:Pectate lyase superfamily protein